MAIKERLLKQLQIVQDGLHAMPPFISRDLRAIHDALVQARDLCFQGMIYGVMKMFTAEQSDGQMNGV